MMDVTEQDSGALMREKGWKIMLNVSAANAVLFLLILPLFE